MAVVAIAVGCGGGRARALPENVVLLRVSDPPIARVTPSTSSTSSTASTETAPRVSQPPVAIAPRDSLRTCREALVAADVRFVDATPAHPTARMPIVDAVMVTTPIHGVTYRYVEPPFGTRLLVDCRFALRLVRASEMLSARGVREVRHLGAYEPRCVKGGLIVQNDTCVPSTHALGMALDLAEFVTANGTVRVAQDFVASAPTGRPTCESARVSPADAFLKELVCALGCDGAGGTFSALLTPNYDAKHRTHVHVDLRPPSKAPWACGVDPPSREGFARE